MAEVTHTPTSIYRYYDRRGVLIYVGITEAGIRRNRQHNGRAEWWPYVAYQEVEHAASRQEAVVRERELIRTYRPPFNRQHNPDSDSLREMYRVVMAQPISTVDPIDFVREMRSIFPLVRSPDHPAELFSLPGHACAMDHLVLTPGARLLNYRGRQAGVVNRIHRAGLVTVIRCSGPIPPGRVIEARVKWVTLQKPIQLALRTINVTEREG